MKSRLIILTALLSLFIGGNAFGWGRDIHATIAYIAERHLTPEAKQNIEACIEGRSIVYFASWMDNYREETSHWRHSAYYDVNTGKPVGTAYPELSSTIEKLKNYKEMKEDDLKLHIYHLLHALGDFHCPGHTYFQNKDRSWKLNSHYDIVFVDGKVTSFHKVWDTPLMRYPRSAFGYMDFAHSLDCNISQEYIDKVTAGDLYEWLCEVAQESRYIYDVMKKMPKGTPKEELSRMDLEILQNFGELADTQILKGGLRMAKVINDIFGK